MGKINFFKKTGCPNRTAGLIGSFKRSYRRLGGDGGGSRHFSAGTAFWVRRFFT